MWTRVQHSSDIRWMLVECIERRGGIRAVVQDGNQAATLVGAERNALLSHRPMAACREHLLTGEDDFDGMASHSRGHRGQRRMRPDGALAAKSSADEFRDDMNVMNAKSEDRGVLALTLERGLTGIVESETVAVPQRDSCMQLHRIVMLDWGGVRDIDPHRRAGEGRFRVAA